MCSTVNAAISGKRGTRSKAKGRGSVLVQGREMEARLKREGKITRGWTGGINQINSNILQVTNIYDNIYSTFIMKYYFSRTISEIVNKFKIV